MFYITASSPLPLYYQLREQIREKIISEEWPYEFEIPSELSLCESLHLSRATVRQAIDDLVNENMLIRMRGKGTYVTYKKTTNFLTEPSFISQVTQLGHTPITKLISCERKTIDKHFALYVGLPLDTMVIHYRRIRGIDNKYIAIDDNFVIEKYAKQLANVDLEKESIYKYLPYDKCKVSIRPVLIDVEDKKLLNVITEADKTSLPFLGLTADTISYLDEQAIMLTKRCYRGDYCNLNLVYSVKNNFTELESSSVYIRK